MSLENLIDNQDLNVLTPVRGRIQRLVVQLSNCQQELSSEGTIRDPTGDGKIAKPVFIAEDVINYIHAGILAPDRWCNLFVLEVVEGTGEFQRLSVFGFAVGARFERLTVVQNTWRHVHPVEAQDCKRGQQQLLQSPGSEIVRELIQCEEAVRLRTSIFRFVGQPLVGHKAGIAQSMELMVIWSVRMHSLSNVARSLSDSRHVRILFPRTIHLLPALSADARW